METEQYLIPLTIEEMELEDDMVAVAVYVEGGEPSHAALIIRHNSQTKILHFLGTVVLEAAPEALQELRYIFIKNLNFIPAFLVPSFLAHCTLIQKEAKPRYGFFYDAQSYYDGAGKFQNPGAFPEYMTCVGFCLTVIQSFLQGKEYMFYADWNHTTYDLDMTWLAKQMLKIQENHPHLKPEDIMKLVRRILPIEYLSAAYAEQQPVRKTFTDEYSRRLNTEIIARVA